MGGASWTGADPEASPVSLNRIPESACWKPLLSGIVCRPASRAFLCPKVSPVVSTFVFATDRTAVDRDMPEDEECSLDPPKLLGGYATF